ncbi:MAG: aminotransferase class V-fold PLP-dependent enzyme [Acidimicrobiia bacterium]|nr:aminotransferase class V-fold PLP-dependent enzyme [Acidimicrobiia bacterium]
MELDVEFVRSQFPAFSVPSLKGQAFFENAGGSYACIQTIDAITEFYTLNKVQPYAGYSASIDAGNAMDASHMRWANVLGVELDEVHFGPSTSANTYVLGQALRSSIGPGDEVIVTNQDHEANTGAIRRMAEAQGATLKEWRVDPVTGMLDVESFQDLLSTRTKLVTFPHCSNVIGSENDVTSLTSMAHSVGARVIVDGVSFAPHTIPNVGDMGADVYLFSLYKVYSVHQGLMVVQNGFLEEMSNQGHFFNAHLPGKRLTPAGPDHAQIAGASGVLDYIEALAAHHDISGTPARVMRDVSKLWRDHETRLLNPLLETLRRLHVRMLGPDTVDLPGTAYRCPTIAFVPRRHPADVVAELVEKGVMTASGHFYAYRVLQGLGIEPDPGVVRLSFVHYTTTSEIEQAADALRSALAS